MATTYFGIDVSVHNGTVNMTSVKKEKSFVMIRAGYGKSTSQKDSKFETNYKNAVAAGLHVGAYWYSYAKTSAEAKLEAQAFLSVIKGKKFDMPLAFDIEDSTQNSLNKTTIDSIVTTFMSTVESAGYYIALYSYESFLNSKISSTVRKKYNVWCANTTKTPSIDYGIHQYSFTGKVSGCTGSVDLDKTTTDYPTIIKNAGLNGYTKTTTTTTTTKTTTATTTTKTTTATAKTTLDTTGFKKGSKDNGVLALKKLLLIAKAKKLISVTVDDTATFGSATEKAVNALLAKWGYKENGIAGEKFIAKLYNAIK
jgi:GH25 family lysozyme M1 (1,4-beta-N-acetylmuramidase)